MATMIDYETAQAAENYCFRRSWRLRLRRRDARWLIHVAAAKLAWQAPADLRYRQAEWREHLAHHLEEVVRRSYGNPVVVWFLLNVVVPIVVKLVIEWWLNRQEA